MSRIHYKGIVWEVTGIKDGKGILSHVASDCTITWSKSTECFMLFQGEVFLLARELRSDCVRDATDCLLDAYANEYTPMWGDRGQEAQAP